MSLFLGVYLCVYVFVYVWTNFLVINNGATRVSQTPNAKRFQSPSVLLFPRLEITAATATFCGEFLATQTFYFHLFFLDLLFGYSSQQALSTVLPLSLTYNHINVNWCQAATWSLQKMTIDKAATAAAARHMQTHQMLLSLSKK